MRGFPQELFFALVFGAILLVQFLYRQWRRKAASMQSQAEPEALAAPMPLRAARTHAAPAGTDADDTTDTAAAAQIIGAPPAAPQKTRSPQVSASAWTRAHRFSKAALMPDRRAVQNAVVIAAILKPCHAYRSHDVEQVPIRGRGALR